MALNLRTAVTSVPPLLDDLSLGGAAQSLLVTIPVLCFACGAFAAPRVRARLGEEVAIAVLLGATVAGMALRAASPQAALFAGTIIAGLGMAGANVLLPSLMKRRFAGRLGPMTAAYTTMLNVGGGIAAALTVPVYHATGDAGAALAIWALPAALALAIWLPQVAVGSSGDRAAAIRRGDARAMWGQPLAWLVMGFMGLQSVTYYGPLSWLPTMLRDHGISSTHAGVLAGVMTAISVIGTSTSPVLAARMRDQRAVAAASVGLVMTGLVGLLVAPAAAPLLWVVILGIGQGGCFALSLLLIVLRAGDGEAAARLSSMAQGGGYLIAAAGPLIVGLLHAASGSWTVAWLFLLAAAGVELAVGLGASRDEVVRHGLPPDVPAAAHPSRGRQA